VALADTLSLVGHAQLLLLRARTVEPLPVARQDALDDLDAALEGICMELVGIAQRAEELLDWRGS
jgi:hypothetical protein